MFSQRFLTRVILFIQSSVEVVERKSKQDLTISKNCSDHFCKIDWINKMSLLSTSYSILVYQLPV